MLLQLTSLLLNGHAHFTFYKLTVEVNDDGAKAIQPELRSVVISTTRFC